MSESLPKSLPKPLTTATKQQHRVNIDPPARISTEVSPAGSLRLLSRREKAAFDEQSRSGFQERLRRCALAVLNVGSDADDIKAVLAEHADFSVTVVEEPRGIRLQLENAPASAFVDGKMITGIREQLFSVVRDLLAAETPEAGVDTSDQVFEWLREAGAIQAGEQPGMVVCWGGHSISRQEYDYSKAVGYELGLRSLNICTGCGPGAMKGPMKGAAIAHAKQRLAAGRYLGITEPGIIAAESPNPIVNELVVMPDVEKRMEAFLRLGHVVLVFPGGVGTAEEILHLLSILLLPENASSRIPLIFTGPASAAGYFQQLDAFLVGCLGEDVRQYYQIIIDGPSAAAKTAAKAAVSGVNTVFEHRRASQDAYGFNWSLKIPAALQTPFVANHENMANLSLDEALPKHELAANLRRLFSGIVAGNVKPEGVAAVEQHGPFIVNGSPQLLARLDTLLESFVDQGRMKLPGSRYEPCYRIIE